MKKGILLIACGIMMVMLYGCKDGKPSDNMSDSERLELLDLQIDRHPKDAALLAERAQVLLNLNRTREALYDINRAVSLKPEEIDYRLLQADAYFASGDIENSYKSLTDAEQIDPNSQEVQLKMGEITFYGRDYDRSLKCLSNVTAKDPNNRTALFMKGFIYKEKGDTAEAVQLLNKVCTLYPDYAPAFEELGILYATRKDPMALEYLSTALRLEPTNTNSMYALAMFHQEREEYAEAVTIYRQMIDVNANSTDAWHNLGYINLFVYGDYEEAVRCFDKAIEADANYIEAYVNRGCAYELQGQKAKAKADFETALSIDSDYAPAQDGLKRIG